MSESSRTTGASPPELRRRIRDLRERFVAAREFSRAFAYFDDHVVCSPDLFPYSDHRDNDRLLRAIHTCTERVSPTFDRFRHRMFEVRGTGFWHGMGQGLRHHIHFFYFDCIDMGMAALYDPLDPRCMVAYLRFSRVEPVGWTMPGRVTPGSA